MGMRTWLEGDSDEIVVHDTDNGSIVFSGICPHFGGPLNYDSETKTFFCPWHDWKFDSLGNCLNRNVSCKVRIIQSSL